MKKDEEILESLVAGGLIGATLGALVSKRNREGATIGAIAGAAILATFKAHEKAKKSNVPVLVSEGRVIYEISGDSPRKEFGKLEPQKRIVPMKFKIK